MLCTALLFPRCLSICPSTARLSTVFSVLGIWVKSNACEHARLPCPRRPITDHCFLRPSADQIGLPCSYFALTHAERQSGPDGNNLVRRRSTSPSCTISPLSRGNMDPALVPTGGQRLRVDEQQHHKPGNSTRHAMRFARGPARAAASKHAGRDSLGMPTFLSGRVSSRLGKLHEILCQAVTTGKPIATDLAATTCGPTALPRLIWRRMHCLSLRSWTAA